VVPIQGTILTDEQHGRENRPRPGVRAARHYIVRPRPPPLPRST